MPTRLQAADIDIKLGAPCVPKEFVQQFMYESFGTPNYMREMSWNKRTAIRVDYSELTSRWSIPNKSHDKENAAANAKYGTKRKSAYEILEDCLNLQSTTVKDRVERDGKEVSVINQTETEFAQEKQRQLQEAFKKWIYAEPARREEVVERYNVMFNSTRPREYDGSALELRIYQNSNTVIHTNYVSYVQRAYLGKSSITVNDFVNLQCGDIIKLNTKASDALSVYVGNIKKFMAVPGKSGENYAVRVTSVIREEE